MSREFSWLLSILMVVAAGCSESGPKICRVTGTATRNGQPVANAILHFFPEKGRPSWGQTDEKGKFELVYDPERNGAQLGKHRVHVEFRSRNPEEEHQIKTGLRKFPADQGAIVEKYSEANSQLTVSIESDPQTVDLKLD